ncbi:Coenzyme F420 hydrogenase/dehydrogenase, beta subunit C-terminal domain [Kineothrix sedimenti]|uniref:Coenzyme F420 hydrogenase/dehydrogenase, beta subunit C-terminal domain n=1 Tax=Kineothrix sedimenti TaxID=3123317 RepID=A0ABZ3EUG6_9FIRM
MNDCNTLRNMVINRNLCTYCGTCVGMCPTNALSADNGSIYCLPEKCIACGKCVNVCPGAEFNYPEFESKLFSKTDIKNSDNTLGVYKYIYSGYSKNENIRKKGASGGIITEILLFLLSTQVVDGVIVTMQDAENIMKVQATIVDKVEDVLSAAQSKYISSPTNVILEQIRGTNKRYAYVGLPCQIQGLHKALENDKKLKDNIHIIVGLFCGFNMSQDATKFLIRKSRFAPNEIEELSYRKKRNDQTGFYIRSNQNEFFIEKHGYTFLNLFFSPERCLACYDYSAEFADISVGDAWEHGIGWSRIICRTEKGEQLLKDIINNDKIVVDDSSVQQIKETQKKIIKHKKIEIWIRKKYKRDFPEYHIYPNEKISFTKRINAHIMALILIIGHGKLGRFLLNIVPFSILIKLSKLLRK